MIGVKKIPNGICVTVVADGESKVGFEASLKVVLWLGTVICYYSPDLHVGLVAYLRGCGSAFWLQKLQGLDFLIPEGSTTVEFLEGEKDDFDAPQDVRPSISVEAPDGHSINGGALTEISLTLGIGGESKVLKLSVRRDAGQMILAGEGLTHEILAYLNGLSFSVVRGHLTRVLSLHRIGAVRFEGEGGPSFDPHV